MPIQCSNCGKTDPLQVFIGAAVGLAFGLSIGAITAWAIGVTRRTEVKTRVVKTFEKIDYTTQADAHPFVNGSATIRDKFVQDVRISEGKVELLFENKTSQNWRPSLDVLAVNAYGIVISGAKIAWLSSIEPGERRTDSSTMTRIPYEYIFQRADLKLPVDEFDTPVFVVIKYH